LFDKGDMAAEGEFSRKASAASEILFSSLNDKREKKYNNVIIHINTVAYIFLFIKYNIMCNNSNTYTAHKPHRHTSFFNRLLRGVASYIIYYHYVYTRVYYNNI
jgi:hypothetical protein